MARPAGGVVDEVDLVDGGDCARAPVVTAMRRHARSFNVRREGEDERGVRSRLRGEEGGALHGKCEKVSKNYE